MAVVEFPSSTRHNPLNDMEDLLDASGYDYTRETDNRLAFLCESQKSYYSIVLEWHIEFEAVKCSVILQDCKDIDESLAEVAIDQANQAAWHGFFIRDGVGNIAFKSIAKLTEDCPISCMALIEDTIDKGIEEADRLYLSLSMHLDGNKGESDTMFPDEEWKVENLALMFSETKGNA